MSNDANVQDVKAPQMIAVKFSAAKEVVKDSDGKPKLDATGKEITKISRPARVVNIELHAPTAAEMSPEQISKLVESIVESKYRSNGRLVNKSKECPFAVDSAGNFLAEQPAINCVLRLSVDDLLPAEETEVSDEQRDALGKDFISYLASVGKSENAQKNNLSVFVTRQPARIAERAVNEVAGFKKNLESFRDNLNAEKLEAHLDALTEVFTRLDKATAIRGEGERDF